MPSKNSTRRLLFRSLLIPATFCVLCLPPSIHAFDKQSTKGVLIISEVGTSNPAPATIVRELVSALSSEHMFEVNLYVESLETPAFTDEASELKAEQQLNAKYQDRNIDIIVALGPTPIVYLSHFAQTFLPGVPVVFCASSQEQTGYVKLPSRFTGSWLQLAPEKTVDAALGLLPGTEEVIVVGGSSAFDKTNEGVVRSGLRSYPRNVEFRYWTDLTMPVLLDRLRHVSDPAVVLYVSLFADAAQNRFVNAATSLPLVTDASAVPVFGMSDSYLGRGVVGGYVLNYQEQGRITAEYALDILHGKSPGTIPIRFVPGEYLFDARQIQRWGLSERNLPTSSTVLYGTNSVWQQIKWTATISLLLVLPLGSLVAYLLYNRRQLKRARDEQTRLSGLLINAYEEERKRIASELHDDFSQRLALLSIGMESAVELVRHSDQEATQQLHELVNSANDLSSDLHDLSHRLHSSTLERLGLVLGVKALCKEYSSQQGVHIDFWHEDEVPSVPSPIALCFYRVVQEALRNIKKHSGASTARVRLAFADDELHLSITDEGAGFDIREPSQKDGIGIFTMGERSRHIGARFDIRSEPGKGTQIDVWKQLDGNSSEEALQEVVRTLGNIA